MVISLIRSKVEGVTEDLTSPPLPREVVYHPENSSQFDQNFQGKAGLSMDVDIEPEDSPQYVPRGKLICNSLYT